MSDEPKVFTLGAPFSQTLEGKFHALKKENAQLREELEAARKWAEVWKRASIHQRKGWRMAADIASQTITKFASHAFKRVVVQFDGELKDELIQARSDARELAEALSEAGYTVLSWAAYASDYFKEKHDLDGDLKAIGKVVSEHGAKYLEQQKVK